jgi:hypothetical protein
MKPFQITLVISLSTFSLMAFASDIPKPDSTTLYTFLAILILGLGLWLVWKKVKSHSTGQMSNTVVVFTGCAGLAIAACSFALSVSYGFTMGSSSSLLSLVFAMIFGAISIAEFVSAYWLERWLSSRNAFLFLIASVLMAVGVMTSIIAGQALIASKIDEVKSQRVMASDAYQAAVAQRNHANARAEQLAISDLEYEQAVQQAQRANQMGKKIIAQANRSYSNCSAWPHELCSQIANYETKTNELNQKLSSHFHQLQQAQLVINRYHQYQAANQRAQELLEIPLPNATQAQLPHVKWLSAVTGVDPDLLEARLYITLAIIAEFVGLMLLFFYGEETRKTRPNTQENPFHQSRAAEVSPLPKELASLNVGGFINSDGIVEVHAGETVLTKELTEKFKDYLSTLPHSSNYSKSHSSNYSKFGYQETPNSSNTTPNSGIKTTSNSNSNSGKTTPNGKGSKAHCAHCGKEFVRVRKGHKYCSKDCSAKAHGFQDNEHAKRQALKKRAKVA